MHTESNTEMIRLCMILCELRIFIFLGNGDAHVIAKQLYTSNNGVLATFLSLFDSLEFPILCIFFRDLDVLAPSVLSVFKSGLVTLLVTLSHQTEVKW